LIDPGRRAAACTVQEDRVFIAAWLCWPTSARLREWSGEGPWTLLQQRPADAAEAIAILRTTPVDVVITDLRLRAIGDGTEVARYVRAHCSGVSLILAAATVPPVPEPSPFDAFFLKPYQPEDIVAWIRRHHARASDHADSSLR
jgi:CheY-like chemotaxis protein